MVPEKDSMTFAAIRNMIAFVIFINFFVSCGASRFNPIPLPVYGTERVAPPVGVRDVAGKFLIGRQDTIPRKTISASEVQKLMSAAYKYNYDTYFKPEFSRLNGVIDAQAKSIGILSGTIDNVRERSIKRNEKQEKEIAKWQKLYGDLLRKQIRETQLNTESNNRQIESSNKLIYYLCGSVAVLFFGMVGLYISNRVLFRRIKQLQNSLNHV